MDRSRVLGALIAYLVLVIASTVVMDWFVMTGGGPLMGGVGTLAIDLRSITMCSDPGPCFSVSFGGIPSRGMYPTLAFATLWGTMLVTVVVAFQAGTRIVSGHASASLSRLGTIGALAMAGTAGAAGFLFGPELGESAAEMANVSTDRTWAPALLVLAHVIGVLTLHWAVSQETLDTEAEYKPVAPLPAQARAVVAARRVAQTQDIKPIGVKPPRAGLVTPEAVRAVLDKPSTGPLPTMPERLRKKVSYTTLAAEVTRAGINARREDGESLLVLWRDVVGVVARRLPPEHDGATFVDVVSTAGATLRILPWTRITGELGGAGDERARALVSYVVEQCSAVELDARTQAFAERGEAAQLPDLAKLAAHDARLA